MPAGSTGGHTGAYPVKKRGRRAEEAHGPFRRGLSGRNWIFDMPECAVDFIHIAEDLNGISAKGGKRDGSGELEKNVGSSA